MKLRILGTNTTEQVPSKRNKIPEKNYKRYGKDKIRNDKTREED